MVGIPFILFGIFVMSIADGKPRNGRPAHPTWLRWIFAYPCDRRHPPLRRLTRGV